MKLILNTELTDAECAHIAINDRGFLLGDGVFETFRCYRGHPFALSAHWQRLQHGLDVLQIQPTLTYDQLLLDIKLLIQANQLSDRDVGMRLTITRGTGPRGLAPNPSSQTTTLLTCFELPDSPPISLTISNAVRCEKSVLSQCKTLGYQENILASQYAQANGFDDALLYNTQGDLACSSRANLFIVHKEQVITPPLSAGCLPGVMRQTVIDIANTSGLACAEATLQPGELNQASEIFLTNSLLEICPVQRFQDRHLNIPAPITTQLQQALQLLIHG